MLIKSFYVSKTKAQGMLTKKSFMWKSKNFYMKLHKIRFLVNPLYSAATHASETFRTGNWPRKVIFWGMHERL